MVINRRCWFGIGVAAAGLVSFSCNTLDQGSGAIAAQPKSPSINHTAVQSGQLVLGQKSTIKLSEFLIKQLNSIPMTRLHLLQEV